MNNDNIKCILCNKEIETNEDFITIECHRNFNSKKYFCLDCYMTKKMDLKTTAIQIKTWEMMRDFPNISKIECRNKAKKNLEIANINYDQVFTINVTGFFNLN